MYVKIKIFKFIYRKPFGNNKGLIKKVINEIYTQHWLLSSPTAAFLPPPKAKISDEGYGAGMIFCDFVL